MVGDENPHEFEGRDFVIDETVEESKVEKYNICFQLKEDFRSALFNVALMLVNDLKRPLDAVPHLNQLLKVTFC